MCHFDILTVCHAVTEPRYLYKHTNRWEAAAVFRTICEQAEGKGRNLNVCHLPIKMIQKAIWTGG